MRKALLATVLGAALSLAGAAAAKQPVVVYTAASEDIHAVLVKAFEAKYPDFEIKTVNASTGPTAARAIAEKANPQADVVYAVNSFYLELLKNEGVFEPYETRGSKIPEQFVDADRFYVNHWLTLMVFAVNTKLAKERNLPAPADWRDLTDGRYKGLISVASPTKSGTGLTIFTTLVDAFGWAYLDKLHPNIALYNSGGGVAGRQAGAGEVMIGMTYDTPVLEQVRAGLPVELVFPSLTPNVTEGGGLVAKSPNPRGGKLFLDFVASPEGAALYKPYVGATTTPGIANLDLSKANLYTMKKPVNIDEFKREWARRYEK